MEDWTQERLAAAFAANRQKLLALAERRLDAVLGKRLSPEDVVSEAYARVATRLDYFAAHDEIPVFYKLRTVLLQTIGDIERRNLKAQGRDAYRERTIRDEMSEFSVGVCASELVADITTPVSRVDRDERHILLRRTLMSLSENDRVILTLRHFEGKTNADCAAILGLTEKAASIRYVRALERLQRKLSEVSCFRKN